MLHKLQKQVSKNVAFSLTTSLEPLLIVFSIGITLVDAHLKRQNGSIFLFSWNVNSLFDIRRCMIFWSPFSGVIRISLSTVSFLALLHCFTLHSFPEECFPSTNCINSFKDTLNLFDKVEIEPFH